MSSKLRLVGHNETKIDGITLACGMPKFAEDIELKNPLYGKILTSIHAHAEIIDIDVSEAEKIPGVHKVFTWKNVPRIPHTTAGQGYPEPSPYDTFILDRKVRFVGDRVAAVVADSLEIAEKACLAIKVTYKELPAVLDAREAMKEGAPVIHDEPEAYHPIGAVYDPSKNLAAEVIVNTGDIRKGEKESDFIAEGTYYAHYAQHCPIETHICCGELDHNNRLVLYTSTQVPFHARRITAQALNIPLKKIRVIKPRIGGGFGAKQEVLLEDLCALMVLSTRRPVVLKLSRQEEFVSSRTRHPIYTAVRAGATKDGKITFLEMKVLSNTGAYGSHALTVMSNAGSKVLPLYPCDNVSFHGQTVYTNLPVGGAYRGYGATQAYFAMECVIDQLSEKLGMDSTEFRLKNHIRENQTSPIFKAIGEGREGNEMYIKSCGLEDCIIRGRKEIGWKEEKSSDSDRFKVGYGMCALMQGSSIPDIDMGAVFIKINDDGSFNMNLGATDLGTGSDTIFAQMAAEILGVDTDDIIVYSSDTDMTPFDVGAYASSTTYLSGYAVIKTAEGVKDQILKVAAEIYGVDSTDGMRLEDKSVHLDGYDPIPLKDIACHSLYSHNQHQIAENKSHITKVSPPPFSAHFAKVEVDTWTGKVRVLKYVAAIDCGTAINPALAEGQNEGASVNGISYAMWEQYIFNPKGKMMNPSFRNYKIMRTVDMPEFKTIMVPTYEPTGPFGAKSVSEISINGGLPAIANAIRNACGVQLYEGPFTPDRVYAALKAAEKN